MLLSVSVYTKTEEGGEWEMVASARVQEILMCGGFVTNKGVKKEPKKEAKKRQKNAGER